MLTTTEDVRLPVDRLFLVELGELLPDEAPAVATWGEPAQLAHVPFPFAAMREEQDLRNVVQVLLGPNYSDTEAHSCQHAGDAENCDTVAEVACRVSVDRHSNTEDT